MNKNFNYEFQPSEERINVIGIPGVESSGRKDGIRLWSEFHTAALYGLKYIREKYPTKYKRGLHLYLGEYNDHLWLGFNNAGKFLVDIFMDQLEKNLPEEYFVTEETMRPSIPMVYSYYPNRILVFGVDKKNGELYNDKEYGTLLELTPGELFSEEMRSLL